MKKNFKEKHREHPQKATMEKMIHVRLRLSLFSLW